MKNVKVMSKVGLLMSAVAGIQACAGAQDSSSLTTDNSEVSETQQLSSAEADLLEALIEADVANVDQDGTMEIGIDNLGEISNKARSAGFSTELLGPTDSLSTFRVKIIETLPSETLDEKVSIDVNEVLVEKDIQMLRMMVHRS